MDFSDAVRLAWPYWHAACRPTTMSLFVAGFYKARWISVIRLSLKRRGFQQLSRTYSWISVTDCTLLQSCIALVRERMQLAHRPPFRRVKSSSTLSALKSLARHSRALNRLLSGRETTKAPTTTKRTTRTVTMAGASVTNATPLRLKRPMKPTRNSRSRTMILRIWRSFPKASARSLRRLTRHSSLLWGLRKRTTHHPGTLPTTKYIYEHTSSGDLPSFIITLARIGSGTVGPRRRADEDALDRPKHRSIPNERIPEVESIFAKRRLSVTYETQERDEAITPTSLNDKMLIVRSCDRPPGMICLLRDRISTQVVAQWLWAGGKRFGGIWPVQAIEDGERCSHRAPPRQKHKPQQAVELSLAPQKWNHMIQIWTTLYAIDRQRRTRATNSMRMN